jgi:hypothetical protein
LKGRENAEVEVDKEKVGKVPMGMNLQVEK